MAVSSPTLIAAFGSSVSGTSLIGSIPSTIPSGTFVVTCFLSSNRTNTVGISDTQGNTWTVAPAGPFASTTSGNAALVQVAWSTLTTGWTTSDSVTVTTSSSGSMIAIVFSLTGVDTASPVRIAATGSTNAVAATADTAFAAPTLSSPTVGDLAIAFGSLGGQAVTLSALGGGFTQFNRTTSSSRAMVVLSEPVTSTSSLTASGTASASTIWAAASMTFKGLPAALPATMTAAASGTVSVSPLSKLPAAMTSAATSATSLAGIARHAAAAVWAAVSGWSQITPPRVIQLVGHLKPKRITGALRGSRMCGQIKSRRITGALMSTQIVRDSQEYLLFTLSDRDAANITGDTVSVAIEVAGNASPTWLGCTYVSGNTWRTTSVITWSSANYPNTSYHVWAKVADSPETAWADLGKLGIKER